MPKISKLPDTVVSIQGNELIPIVQDGETRQAQLSDLSTYFLTDIDSLSSSRSFIAPQSVTVYRTNGDFDYYTNIDSCSAFSDIIKGRNGDPAIASGDMIILGNGTYQWEGTWVVDGTTDFEWPSNCSIRSAYYRGATIQFVQSKPTQINAIDVYETNLTRQASKLGVVPMFYMPANVGGLNLYDLVLDINAETNINYTEFGRTYNNGVTDVTYYDGDWPIYGPPVDYPLIPYRSRGCKLIGCHIKGFTTGGSWQYSNYPTTKNTSQTETCAFSLGWNSEVRDCYLSDPAWLWLGEIQPGLSATYASSTGLFTIQKPTADNAVFMYDLLNNDTGVIVSWLDIKSGSTGPPVYSMIITYYVTNLTDNTTNKTFNLTNAPSGTPLTISVLANGKHAIFYYPNSDRTSNLWWPTSSIYTNLGPYGNGVGIEYPGIVEDVTVDFGDTLDGDALWWASQNKPAMIRLSNGDVLFNSIQYQVHAFAVGTTAPDGDTKMSKILFSKCNAKNTRYGYHRDTNPHGSLFIENCNAENCVRGVSDVIKVPYVGNALVVRDSRFKFRDAYNWKTSWVDEDIGYSPNGGGQQLNVDQLGTLDANANNGIGNGDGCGILVSVRGSSTTTGILSSLVVEGNTFELLNAQPSTYGRKSHSICLETDDRDANEGKFSEIFIAGNTTINNNLPCGWVKQTGNTTWSPYQTIDPVFTIKRNSGDTFITVYTSASANYLPLSGGLVSGNLTVSGVISSNNIILGSSATLGIMNVLSSGKIGINTSSPNETLSIVGTLSTTGRAALMGGITLGDGSSNYSIVFNSPNTHNMILLNAQPIVSRLLDKIEWNKGSYWTGQLFYVGGVEKMNITSTGVNVTGTLSASSSVESLSSFILRSPDGTRWKITVDNAGLLAASPV